MAHEPLRIRGTVPARLKGIEGPQGCLDASTYSGDERLKPTESGDGEDLDSMVDLRPDSGTLGGLEQVAQPAAVCLRERLVDVGRPERGCEELRQRPSTTRTVEL